MNFKVEHFYTGELVEHNELLKRLVKEAGITRNEWHKRIALRALSESRCIGGPTKLSDIFSGKRDMPIRDLVFAFEALELGNRETKHYICEYMKAYLPPSTRSYIKPTKWKSSNENLKLRISFLESQLAEHRQEITFLKKGDITNPLHPLCGDKYQIANHYPIDPTEVDQDHGVHHWIDQSRHAAQMSHFDTIKMWHHISNETLALDHNLEEIILYCIAPDIADRLEILFDESLSSGGWSPMSFWQWTRAQPSLIPTGIFIARLLDRWKTYYPIEFELWHKYHAECAIEGSYFAEAQTVNILPFYDYLGKVFRELRKKAPNLYHFFSPIQDSFFADFRFMESNAFQLYRSYETNMNSHKVSFNDFLASLWPSLADMGQSLTKLNEIVMELTSSNTSAEAKLNWTN